MTPTRELLQFARLFDFVQDILAWIKDREGRYCWVNRSFVLNCETMAGISEKGEGSSILGKTDYEMSPVFLADQFRMDDEQVLAGNSIVNRIELVGESGGENVWHVTNKIPLLNSSGEVIGSAGITRRLNASNRVEGVEPGFGNLLVYIRDHYAAALTNEQLAAVAHMSTRSFERNFLRLFRTTPQQYLRRIRLRTASRTLVFSELPLAQVAQISGFSDQSHFTREFRRHYGRTPRQYRAYYQSEIGPGVPSTKSAAPEQ